MIGIPTPRGDELAQALTVDVVDVGDLLLMAGELARLGGIVELLELVEELADLVVTYRDESKRWQEAALGLMGRERSRKLGYGRQH